MKIVNQVFETRDYSKFGTLSGNRDLISVHVKKLKQSFLIAYLMCPIIVNQYFKIIDGQNRFEAAKQLGLPIYYIIVQDYGLREVQLLNTNTKNWKKPDYLKSYCDLGKPEYLKFRNFTRRFSEFGINSCKILLTNKLTTGDSKSSDVLLKSDTNKTGSFAVREFENGDLKIPDYEKSVENAEKLLMFKKYYDGFNRQTFVIAMLGIFRKDEYSHSKMIHKLELNPTALKHCANVMQYKMLIEDIYNYKSRDKNNFRF